VLLVLLFKCILNAFEMHHAHNAPDHNALFSYALFPNAFEMHFKCIEG